MEGAASQCFKVHFLGGCQVGALRDIKAQLAARRDALQQGIVAQIEAQVSRLTSQASAIDKLGEQFAVIPCGQHYSRSHSMFLVAQGRCAAKYNSMGQSGARMGICSPRLDRTHCSDYSQHVYEKAKGKNEAEGY